MRAVLAGAGHAHLYCAKRAAEFSRRGIELVLIAPEAFWYSGLATAMLGGKCSPEADQVDVAALVAHAGGRAICGRIAHVDPGRRTIHLQNGESLAYDVLSLDLGSEPLPIPGSNDRVYAAKPISTLWRLRCDVRQAVETGRHDRIRVIVAGGGAAGCEIAANLVALAHPTGPPLEVTVLTSAGRLLATSPRSAGEIAFRVLSERGVRIVLGARVRSIDNDAAITADGRNFGFDFAVNATGLRPLPTTRCTGLPCDANGALLVDRYLRSIGDRFVFGGGDCITFNGQALPRLGVYAVREAPVLFRNLIAAAEGRPPEPYVPQKRALTILNLGDGTGLAVYGRFSLRSPVFGWLKQRIDRTFLSRYRITEKTLPAPTDRVPIEGH